MNRILLTTLCLMYAPATALAAPAVLFHVNDRAVEAVPGADVRLGDENAAIVQAEQAVEDKREQKKLLREHRQDARERVRHERSQLREAKRELRQAERDNDVAAAATARANLEVDAREFADAEDHLQWHHEQIATVRAALKVARVDRSLARAEIELEQAEILAERTDDGPILGREVFANQADRIRDRASMREADRMTAEARSSDALTDYVCRTGPFPAM